MESACRVVDVLRSRAQTERVVSTLRFVSEKRVVNGAGRMYLPDIMSHLASQHALLAQALDCPLEEGVAPGQTECLYHQKMEGHALPTIFCDLWGRIRWLNRAAEALCGYDRDRLIGLPYYGSPLLTTEGLLTLSRVVSESLLKVQRGPHELTVVRSDGSLRFVELRVQVSNCDHRRLIVCVAVDVTKKVFQEILREAARASDPPG